MSETALADAFQFQFNHLAFARRHGKRSSDFADDTTYTQLTSVLIMPAATLQTSLEVWEPLKEALKCFLTLIA